MNKEDIVFRAKRNALLKDCDWTQLPNAPLTDTKKKEWETYRQALRELPKTASPKLDSIGAFDDASVTFPTKPS
mgnify:CR=1 FL=1